MKIFKKNKPTTYLKSSTEEVLKVETFVRPFFLAFDFEALLIPQASKGVTGKNITKIHQPIGFVLKGYSANDFDYKFNTVSYVNEDCAKHFVSKLEETQEEIVKALKKYYFKKYDKELHDLCEKECKCKIMQTFKKELNTNKKPNIPHKASKIDHDPRCKFVASRGLLLRKEWSRIPIYGYNSGKYDLTFLVAHMLNPNMPITNIITRNNSYLKISYGCFDFLDAHNLVPMNVNLNRFAEMWGVKNISKEINAYDWLDSEAKLKEPFPPIENFHNSLKKEDCPQIDYDRALELYKEKGFTCYSDWMMYYCERDVDLLIEGLNKYRKITLEESKMELCNYISISQIAYTNALKNYIKLPLFQIENENMFSVIDKSIFGGNCQVFERYSKVGNKDAEDNDVKLIISLDENNLYGHSLQKRIPYGRFTFCEDPYQCNVLCTILNEVSRQQQQLNYEERHSTKYLHSTPTSFSDNKGLYAFTGFICCSLFYTDAQKEKMKYFPPLPSRISPDHSFMRSDYMKKVKEGFGIKDSRGEKLVYSLCPQPVYYIYSEMLKYLLENDMITLDKIYKFVYTPIGYVYHDYIQAMTKKRQTAEDMKRQANNDYKEGKINEKERNDKIQIGDSQKEYAKLNNNSCYGKTLQSDENFDTSVIVTSKQEFLKKTIGRALLDFNVLAIPTKENIGSVELKYKKDKYEIKSPKYIGSATLWNSKMLMIDFIYNCLYEVYSREEVKIMYTDTDSLYLRFVQTPNGKVAPTTYQEFLARFDEKPEWQLLKERHFSKDGELTCGKMKLEKNIHEAVFLQPKCYCLDTESKNPNERVVPKMKGVSINQNKHLEMNKYKQAYTEGIRVKGTNNMILKNTKVEMVTVEQNKWALTPYDDKRLWISENKSEAWGYREIEFNPDIVFARIVRNCAKRVKINIPRFLEYLGCSLGEFRKHIEEGMNEIPYCSYLTYKTYWNIDHQIPLGNRDLNDENVLKELCHYTNLNPMTVAENSRKRDKEINAEKTNEKEKEINEIIHLLSEV